MDKYTNTQIVSLYIVLQIPVNKVSQSTDSSVCYILTISKVDKDKHSWLIPEFSSCSSNRFGLRDGDSENEEWFI